jgi:hypothetical protein
VRLISCPTAAICNEKVEVLLRNGYRVVGKLGPGTASESHYFFYSVFLSNDNKTLEEIKTHLLYSTNFSFENHDVYETIWKNIVQSG